LFRARADLGKATAAPIPPVIPIVRPPDDPGIDEEPVADEFAEQVTPVPGQAGGWRGFLSRWGG
jgi:HemY protein